MNIRTNWTVVLLFLIYPFVEMSSAGWAATSIVYLWPAALCAFSLIPFVKAIKGAQIRGFEYPFYVIALIIAANQEQTAALLFGFGLVFTVYIIIRDKCINKFLIFCNIISLGGLILIILCPGNINRTISETATWFPIHSTLSMKFKLFHGICNTLKYLFYEVNTFIFILTIILIDIIIKKKIGKIPTVLASVTVIFCFLTNSTNLRATLFSPFNRFLTNLDLQNHPYNGMASLIAVMVCCFVLGIILLEIFLIYGKSNKSGLLLLIICAGLSSAFIIGFSPTIYASGYRIFLFLNLNFIAAIILITKFEWESFSPCPKLAFYFILIYGGVCSNYIDSLISLYNA